MKIIELFPCVPAVYYPSVNVCCLRACLRGPLQPDFPVIVTFLYRADLGEPLNSTPTLPLGFQYAHNVIVYPGKNSINAPLYR